MPEPRRQRRERGQPEPSRQARGWGRLRFPSNQGLKDRNAQVVVALEAEFDGGDERQTLFFSLEASMALKFSISLSRQG